MGKVISIGVQKGGVGKSTTTSILAYILYKIHKKNVLVIDFDGQGNSTQILSRKNLSEFEGKTILDSIINENIHDNIFDLKPQYADVINKKKFDLLAADDLISTLGSKASSLNKNVYFILKEAIKPLIDDYDFILIDQPPNLGDQTISSLVASDYAVVMLQTEPLCYNAIPRYFNLIRNIKQEKFNANLYVAGILCTMQDRRTKIDSQVINAANDEYKDFIFNTIIHRKTRIKEFSLIGIQDRIKEDKEALLQYKDFAKELIKRVK